MGAISIDELQHALADDIHALKDVYNIKFVKGTRLRLCATDGYGRRIAPS